MEKFQRVVFVVVILHHSILVGQEVVQLLLQQVVENREVVAPVLAVVLVDPVVDQENMELEEREIPLQQVPLKEIMVVVRHKQVVVAAVQEVLVEHNLPELHQALAEMVRMHGQEIVH